jgi:stage II sporulation protein D
MVRISLFSLFKTELLHARVLRNESAIIDAGSGQERAKITSGDLVRMRLRGKGIDLVILDSHNRVKKYINTTEARIDPQGSASFELVIPGRMKREVRGQLSATTAKGQGRSVLQITLLTDIESAVASVTAAEMSGLHEVEAIKALSIIARTYMLSHKGRHSDEGFDFCDTTHCQLYRGESDLSEEIAMPRVASAVESTAGEWLSFEKEPVEVYFTAVCGGLTATPEMVWGGSVSGRYHYKRVACHWCNKSNYINWERSASAATVIDALSAYTGRRLSPETELKVESEKSGELALKVFIQDRGRQTVMTADEFRRALGRRLGWNKVISTTFNIERRGERMIFRGKGFGSQVGLCLIGAVAQAAAGKSYRDILNFYFPQAEISGAAAR